MHYREDDLLNHIGDLELDLRWEGDLQFPGRLHIDDKVKGHRLLDREISGLGALEDAVDVGGCTASSIGDTSLSVPPHSTVAAARPE